MTLPNLHILYPTSFWGNGPPETCYRICSHWPGQGLPVRVYAAACLRGDPAQIMAPALPMVLPQQLQRRIASLGWVRPILERRSVSQVIAAIRPEDLCYCWPGTPLDAIEAARSRGAHIVLEFINTHVAYAKRVLDAECDRVGAPRYTHFTEASLKHETVRVGLADLIFAPGPFVEQSIREVEKEVPQIAPVSYGSYLPTGPISKSIDQPTKRPLRFLFVGSVGLRKGAHVLMEAWRRAALPAELWIAGSIEKHIATHDLQSRFLGNIPDSVRFLGHVSDMSALYREVDAFVFPSLEEGGPQVTYEAAAHGIPLIVTPMGGGWIARDQATALVVPPADAEALAQALTRMHDDATLRLELGTQALADAPHYAWDQVADRRRKVLLDFARTPAP